MSLLDSIAGILRDPPPEFVFEIAADGIAVTRTRPPATLRHAPLAEGVVVPSPVKDNIPDPAAFTAAVTQLIPPQPGRKSCALILPDNSVRVSVLDFESLPGKDEEKQALIRFRLRKTLPFDVDTAALSWHAQTPKKIVAAVTPAEIIARYESPFRAAGLKPGLVTSTSLAFVDLLPTAGSLLAAVRSPGGVTVLALQDGLLTMLRTLELTPGAPDPLEEISSDIYPTIVYLEDQTGHRPAKLILAGFGEDSDSSATRLSVELDLPVEAIPGPHPGIAGYLAALSGHHPQQRSAA
jgi:type IV pilus assembly protein PilM